MRSHHHKTDVFQANLQLTCSGQRLLAWRRGVREECHHTSAHPSLHVLVARDRAKLTTLMCSASGPAARPQDLCIVWAANEKRQPERPKGFLTHVGEQLQKISAQRCHSRKTSSHRRPSEGIPAGKTRSLQRAKAWARISPSPALAAQGRQQV